MKNSKERELVICPNCDAVFEAGMKNGICTEPVGPYCDQNDECEERYGNELTEYIELRSKEFADFARKKEKIDLVHGYPELTKKILELLEYSETWLGEEPQVLSMEAQTNIEYLRGLMDGN
jgi:hypothetical protein